MAPVVAVTNQKGGVGKTTTVVNLAAYAGLGGLRTLVIDSDPQANATSALGVLPSAAGSIYTHAEPMATSAENVWLVPAGPELAEHARPWHDAGHELRALHMAVQQLQDSFELILIDCPPNFTALPRNALLVATQVVIPVQCEYFALEGLSQLLAHIEELHGSAPLADWQILLTMASPGALARSVIAEVRRHFGDRVLSVEIPRDEAAAVAPSHGRALLDHDPLCPAALAYLAVTRELLSRWGSKTSRREACPTAS
ncbi:MAG: ParA family protein [Planctomycetota bacterium]|nr:ParA family protein [Planctomycetota bacterium]